MRTKKMNRILSWVLYGALVCGMIFSAQALSTSPAKAASCGSFCYSGWQLISTQTTYYGDCHTVSSNYYCADTGCYTNCIDWSNCDAIPVGSCS